jgi:hypothetical protein
MPFGTPFNPSIHCTPCRGFGSRRDFGSRREESCSDCRGTGQARPSGAEERLELASRGPADRIKLSPRGADIRFEFQRRR